MRSRQQNGLVNVTGKDERPGLKLFCKSNSNERAEKRHPLEMKKFPAKTAHNGRRMEGVFLVGGSPTCFWESSSLQIPY